MELEEKFIQQQNIQNPLDMSVDTDDDDGNEKAK